MTRNRFSNAWDEDSSLFAAFRAPPSLSPSHLSACSTT